MLRPRWSRRNKSPDFAFFTVTTNSSPDIATLGASAGGLEAPEKLLLQLPPEAASRDRYRAASFG